MSDYLPKTVVEFVDTKPQGVGHITREIRVNGSPVLVAEGGISVEMGSPVSLGLTTVTLELIATEIHYVSEGGA